jgi:hypothetical protein
MVGNKLLPRQIMRRMKYPEGDQAMEKNSAMQTRANGKYTSVAEADLGDDAVVGYPRPSGNCSPTYSRVT